MRLQYNDASVYSDNTNGIIASDDYIISTSVDLSTANIVISICS